MSHAPAPTFFGLVPKSVGSIAADPVAKALVDAIRDAAPGVRILKSGEMQRSAAG